MDTKTVLVFAGGDWVDLAGPLPSADYVIAADSGLDRATSLGVTVDLLVGDLDSVSPEGLAAARQAGVSIEQHPPDKDATDLELSLAAAVRKGDPHRRSRGRRWPDRSPSRQCHVAGFSRLGRNRRGVDR